MEQKKRLLNDLLKITKEQARCLDKKDYERFYKLLDIRQKILVQYLKYIATSPGLDEEETLLKARITKIHQNNTERMSNELEIVKKELRKLRSKKKTANVYKGGYNSTYQGGMFFDKRNQ
ncbi:hypothetical protein AN642_01300 [Epulopiscium sp. SCG-B10WGA-EpuloA2]|nr:hypothetical protein AN642_01300 [Epulopiscium sp. SCG-B10WGA-EpuloA2]